MRLPPLALAMALAPPAAPACEVTLAAAAGRIAGERFVLAWRTDPPAIRVGEPFAVELAVCRRSGAAGPEALAVDAHMPAHRHGMNYAPALRRTAPGRYRADGLLLHMPGEWELWFDLGAGGDAERLTGRVQLR